MKDNYKEIGGILSGNLEDNVRLLLRYAADGERVYINFNGHKLYSDTVTMDSAYLECTGKTKAEYVQYVKEWREKLDREEKEYLEQIPLLATFYKEEGRSVLDEKYWDKWDECVPIRLCDLYRGMELECCLEIVKALNGGCELEYAKNIIACQGHSGMSFYLVKTMVRDFCDRGQEFANSIDS